MSTPHIGVVLAAVGPQQQQEVAALLEEELAKKIAGGACIIPVITGGGTAQETVREILAALERSGLIGTAENEPVYSAEEEEKIRKRLEDLGYL